MNVFSQIFKQPRAHKIILTVLTNLLILDLIISGLIFIASTLFDIPQIDATFLRLGYPLYLIPLIGIIKLITVVAILKGTFWRKFAHAGLVFLFLIAFYSHIRAGDGLALSLPPLFALFLNISSFVFWKKTSSKRKFKSAD